METLQVWGQPLADPEHERLRIGLAALSEELRSGALQPSSTTAETGNAAFLGDLREALRPMPKAMWPRLATSVNEDQVESKLWLLEQLGRVDLSQHRIVILGAWYGLLAMMMDRLLARPPAETCCVDIDPGTCELAREVLSILSSPPDVICADMLAMDYAELSAGRPTIFINTSCEHLANFAGWRDQVPTGAHLVLQSNNHLGCLEHVNCVPDIDAFERQARLSHVTFRGSLPLRRFTRFMLIGRA